MTSAGSSARRDGGRRNVAPSRPTHASCSARRAFRSASSGGTAKGKLVATIREASTVIRRASTVAASYSSSARAVVHLRAWGSSVSCPRSNSITSPLPLSDMTKSSKEIEATRDPPRMQNTMRPSLSTASNPKNCPSVAIEVRGDSKALIVYPSTAPQSPETSIRLSSIPARAHKSRTSAGRETEPRRPFSQWPSRQFSPSDQMSFCAGNQG